MFGTKNQNPTGGKNEKTYFFSYYNNSDKTESEWIPELFTEI